MLQRLTKAIAQVKAGNRPSDKSDKSFVLCIEQNKLLKKQIII